MTNKFKVGDRVKCIKNDYFCRLTVGKIYEIENDTLDVNFFGIWNDDLPSIDIQAYNMKNFELVERKIGDQWYKAEELNEDGTPIDKVNKNTLFIDLDNQSKSNPPKDPVMKAGRTFTMKNEEFKIDKLGWYKCKDTFRNRHYYVVYFCKDKNIVLALSKEDKEKNNHNYEEFNLLGQAKYYDTYNRWSDLIEYLGLELPKEPRVFEFESIYKTPYSGGFESLSSSIEEMLDEKKWHVIMKEIIE